MTLTGRANLMSHLGPVDLRSPANASDEALLRRLRDGDAAAGNELVTRYYPALLRYLQRVIGAEQAEELLQQTWLSVLSHADKFESGGGAGGLKAWLFRIATNKAHDCWRARARDRSAREGLRLVSNDAAPAADTRLEHSEQEEKLKWAMQQLPENQRQVLLLRYYSGLKFVEIADVIGCPLNTALGRAHKAMIRLKLLMEDERDRVTGK